jgi:hypothetical protein
MLKFKDGFIRKRRAILAQALHYVKQNKFSKEKARQLNVSLKVK